MKTSLFFTGLLFIALCNFGCTNLNLSKNKQNTYTISVSKENIRTVYVDANITVENKIIFMDWESASFLKNGWSHFVNEIKAFNKNGKELQLKYLDNATWLVEKAKINQEIRLKYSIQIKHDRINWEQGGHDESAYVVDNCLFFVGSAVFITGSKNIKTTYKLNFNFSEDWKMVSSINKTAEQKFITNGENISKSCFFLGEILQHNLNLGNLNVQLASTKQNETTLQILSQIIPPVTQGITNYFEDESEKNFLCIVNIAPNTEEFKPYFSGGAFPKALSLILPNVPDENTIPVIGYLFAHEFTHLWNGIDLQAKEPSLENWFIEGYTDYITLKTLLKLGFIDQEFFLNNRQGINDQFNKYKQQVGKISMRKAGLNKQEYYDLVYSGGFIMAFITDIELAIQSNSNKSLKNFMQGLLVEFKNKKYDYKTMLNQLNKQTNFNFETTYQKYVLEKEIIPLNKYLQKIGLEFSEEQKIIEINNTTNSKKELLKFILSN